MALLPFALIIGVVALVAAVTGSARSTRFGLLLLVVYAGAAALGVLGSSGDWVHLLWSVEFALVGFLAISGLLVARVWADDRREPRSWLGRRSGAPVALAAIVALGGLPFVALAFGADPYPSGRVDGHALPALLEVVRFGFGGPVPELMVPEHAAQLERGLGSPPRFVTVPMGAALLGAVVVVVVCVVALVGRAIPAGRARRVTVTVLPGLASVGLLLAITRGLEDALWANEPWLVRAVGPALLVSILLGLTLLVAVRIDGLRRAAVTHPDGPRPRPAAPVSNRVIATG